MRIAVTTPTGNVGAHVVSMLVRAGVRPCVLMRDASRLDPDLREWVDIREVDQFVPDTVVAAAKDVDALYWVDPTTGSEDPLGDYARATDSLTSAASANGVSRVVFQSSIGAEKRHGVGEIDGLAATEVALDRLCADGALDDVTHLRCGFFFSNLLLQLDAVRSGTIPVIVPPDMPMGWVAPRDIAEVAVTRLLSTNWNGRVVQAVQGPADLSWLEAAEVISTVTGHRVTVEQIDDQAMRDLLRTSGMTPALADAVTGMSTGLREDFVPEQERTPQTTTPTTLSSWVHDVLAPQLSSAG